MSIAERIFHSILFECIALLLLTLAAHFGVQEFQRPKTEEQWNARTAWDWSTFAPLIHEKEGSWQSDCLSILLQ